MKNRCLRSQATALLHHTLDSLYCSGRVAFVWLMKLSEALKAQAAPSTPNLALTAGACTSSSHASIPDIS